MRLFSEFISERILDFEVDGVRVVMEPVPFELYERHIIGVDAGDAYVHAKPKPKSKGKEPKEDEVKARGQFFGKTKYRVTFFYPTSKQFARSGPTHYEQEVRYVVADSPADARDRVAEFVRSKKRYLGDMRKADMKLRVKPVARWGDLVDMATYIAQKRPRNPTQYFDRNDLAILVRQARQDRDFNQTLLNLPREVQVLLKTVYLRGAEDLNLSEPSRSGLVSQKVALDRSMQNLKNPPKPVYKSHDEDPEVDDGSSVYDIIKQAKLYGISYADLKKARNRVLSQVGDFPERERAWRDIDQRHRQSVRRGVKRADLQGDAGEFDRHGGDDWTTELVRQHPFLNGDDPYAKWVDFYKQGRPQGRKPSEVWLRALHGLIGRKSPEELEQERAEEAERSERERAARVQAMRHQERPHSAAPSSGDGKDVDWSWSQSRRQRLAMPKSISSPPSGPVERDRRRAAGWRQSLSRDLHSTPF